VQASQEKVNKMDRTWILKILIDPV